MLKLRVLAAGTFTFLICLLLIAGCTSSTSDKEPVSIEISESSYEPMNEYLNRFSAFFSENSNETLSEKQVDELFPAEEIPPDQLSWFLESREDVTVHACKGIQFDNDDILIVYFYDAEVPDKKVSEYVTINIEMYGSPLIPPPNVYEYSGSRAIGDGFGVMAYSFYGSDMDDMIADIAFNTIEH